MNDEQVVQHGSVISVADIIINSKELCATVIHVIDAAVSEEVKIEALQTLRKAGVNISNCSFTGVPQLRSKVQEMTEL